MEKLIALTASILVAATSGALAHKPTVLTLHGVCDVLTINNNKTLKTALVAKDDPSCEALFGAGFIGKVKDLGNSAIIGLQSHTVPNQEFVIRIDYPFITGGNWVLYSTTDGVTLTALAGDTYTVDSGPVRSRKELKPATSFAAH